MHFVEDDLKLTWGLVLESFVDHSINLIFLKQFSVAVTKNLDKAMMKQIFYMHCLFIHLKVAFEGSGKA